MKRFESLGRSLSKGEQKAIVGGDRDEGGSVPCNMGTVICRCGLGPTYYCCIDFLPSCIAAHGCPNDWNCQTL